MTTHISTSTAKSITPSQFTEASKLWFCSEPRHVHKNCKSALIWKDQTQKQRPLVQLCMDNEPSYTIQNIRTEDSKYMFIEISPGTTEQCSLLHGLDQYALDLVDNNCKAWFGKELTMDQITSMYVPVMQPTAQTINLRLSIQNCNVWRISHARRTYSPATLQDIWEGCQVVPCIAINGIYFKAREMGLSLTCSAILVLETTSLIPFHLSDDYKCEERTETCDMLPEHEDMESTISAHA